MTNLQHQLKSVCEQLGLDITIPFRLEVNPGQIVEVLALIHRLGGKLGIVIVSDFEEVRGLHNEIYNLGYGFSTLQEPSSPEPDDLQNYIDMFSEWGWTGPEDEKPSWYIEYPDSSVEE